LLAAAALLDDLNKAGLQLLDRGNVVGEDTHISSLGGQVNLDAAVTVPSAYGSVS